MSHFAPVDSAARLWQVRDLLPAEQAAELISADWLAMTWHPGDLQQSWPRRQINWDDAQAQRLGHYINAQLPVINAALGTSYTRAGGHFWVDLPGFEVAMHTDGHVPNAMQLYWTVPGPEYGTGFYHYKQRNSLLYQFASEFNSGYIMLNHLNEDGSQPLQWHGMFCAVPQGTIRVSSYWRFE